MTGLPDWRGDMPGFTPTRTLRVDISQPIPAVSAVDPENGKRYARALSFVLLHTQMLGVVELPLPEAELSASKHAHLIWSALSQQINDHLRADGEPSIFGLDEAGVSDSGSPRCLAALSDLLADGPLTTVVVSTRERPESLERCLRSIRSLTYPSYEVIVVDNAPRTTATFDLMKSMVGGHNPEIRYIREDRPGLSSARNRALAEARGQVIAFTDDDVIVDRCWLAHLVAGFRRAENVACVTGNILPAELETPAQMWVERSVGFGKGNARRIFDLAEHRLSAPLYPYTAGTFGSGANLAFAAPVLREIGGFDPALSTGTLARGGEDLAAFFTVITRGYRLVYEPAAIVLHHHHREYAKLRSQMYGYGVGLTAYLTKCVLDDPRRAFDLLKRVPSGLSFLLGRQKRRERAEGVGYPRDLARAELMGMAYGPLAYLRSRRNTPRRTLAAVGR